MYRSPKPKRKLPLREAGILLLANTRVTPSRPSSLTVKYYFIMSARLRRVLSLGRKSSVGDSTEGVACTSDGAAGESSGEVKSRAQPVVSSKRLLGVFGGLEGRRSSSGNDKDKDKLTESIDLKMSSQFASLIEEMDGVKDESPLIKARRDELDDVAEVAEGDEGDEVAGDHLKRTTTVTSMLSQMTTHDVAGQGPMMGTSSGAIGTGLGNASMVDVEVGLLKRTLEESEGDEVWYTSSAEEGFVDTHSVLREASAAHKLVGMERKLDVFSGQIRQCVVASMKMEHLSAQIHRLSTSATKAQMDIERRMCSLAEAVRLDKSLAAQVAELESKVRLVRSQLSQLEDDLEQERVVQQELVEARGVEEEQERARGMRISGVVAFVARNLAVSLLVIAFSGVRRRA